MSPSGVRRHTLGVGGRLHWKHGDSMLWCSLLVGLLLPSRPRFMCVYVLFVHCEGRITDELGDYIGGDCARLVHLCCVFCDHPV